MTRLVGKFVNRRLCDGPLDRPSSPPKDAISEMEIDCPDHVRENHRVVEGLSPHLYPPLEPRNDILSAAPGDSAHALEVPDLPCSVQ